MRSYGDTNSPSAARSRSQRLCARSSPHAIRRRSLASSSFYEPLVSALAGPHDRDARPPPVLPMLPNGSPASFRSSMPVRAVAGVGDGIAESWAAAPRDGAPAPEAARARRRRARAGTTWSRRSHSSLTRRGLCRAAERE
ncbi:hypothetical protein B0H19DRAFT_1123445, partial [Mycena capillaripes]